jgi:adenylate cyclase
VLEPAPVLDHDDRRPPARPTIAAPGAGEELRFMAQQRVQRRLAAIMAADVVGYSRLIEADEEGVRARLRSLHAELIDPAIAAGGGRIVKTMGDGLLVEFASAIDAVRSALDIQAALARSNAELGGDRRIELRIGINVGDIIVEGDDIHGDGVNVASRLEGLCEPGAAYVSGTVFDQAAGKLDAAFDDLGEKTVKNIARPVRVYRVSRGADAAPGPAAAARAPLSLPDKPSIAVLPFDNMSRDPDQDYFADGVAETITAALSRIRAFFVIARNSAFTYKGRAENVRTIGRDLGVAYVLEGSVQRAGDRLRITVQLIETEGGAHLWAEKYDGALDDIFDLQDRITEQVAGALEPSIRLAEIERAQRRRPQELGAYDYTMRAMRHVWMLERAEAALALELLEKALEIDPDYPLALALAGWCWAQRSVYNWADDIAAAKANSLALAEKAASLSSDDPLILAVLGAVHTFSRNYGAARVLLERAVAIDPNSAWALSRLGWLEVYCDHPDEATALFERALRLSPLDPMNFNNYVGLAAARQVAGDDSAAADLFQRALAERPNALWIHRNLAPVLQAAGRLEEARKSRDALIAAYPDLTIAKFREALVFSPRLLDRLAEQMRALGIPEE